MRTSSCARPRASRASPRAGRRRSRSSCRSAASSAHARPSPRPAGPAKACAMSSQRSASAPVGDEVGVGAVDALGDQQAEVVRRPGHPLRGVLRAPGPHARPTARPARPGTPRPAAPAPCTAKEKSRVRTPRWATCRIRSVTSGRDAERLVHVERVRPGLHEAARSPSRSADIGGPNHGIFWPVGVRRAARRPARLARRPPAGEQRRRAARRRPRAPAGRRSRSGSAIASQHQRVPGRLVGGRGAAPPRRSRPGGRPGWRRPSRPPASASASRPRRGRRRAPRAGRPRRRGRRARSSSSRSSVPPAGAVVEDVAPSGRGSARGARVSSVIVSARPRPRTRSRVACTSSRTPGRDSSAPSSSTVSRCVSRPTRCSSGATAASSGGVGAGRDPELEGGGEDRRR